MLQFEEAVPASAGLGLQPGLQLQHVVPDGETQHAVRPASSGVLTDTAKMRRVNVADKRVINGQTDVNQLVPFK